MVSVKERLTAARERSGLLDHVLRMQEHYGGVKAGQQAGAITYFAFLSFFPILALSFFVVGLVSQFYPDANANLRTAIDSVLPGIIGSGDNQISLDDIRTFSGLAGAIGVLGVLYSGLAWVSALRDALFVVFETPAREVPSFIKGKLRDLMTLAVIGLVLILAVAVAGFVSGRSKYLLELVSLGTELSWLVKLVAIVLGLAANAVLFYAVFRLLAEPDVPKRSLWSGAVLGALGFEVLKQVSSLLLSGTEGQPAFQAFGIALILLVWINYFSRLVLYSAAWAYTTKLARELRVVEPDAPPQGPATPDLLVLEESVPAGAASSTRSWVAPFAAGGASALALAVLLRKKD
ncbi:YihY/virulence factor BrkB family protein [soil metagenome]